MKYKTKQREIILNCLRENSEKHLSAMEISDCLKSEGTEVGQTTVYRTLEKLVNEGVVLRYSGSGGMGACYQYAEQCKYEVHYHLMCSECGKLIHLECKFLDELSEHIYESHKFILDGFKTVFYGTCKECSDKRKNNNYEKN